MINGNGLLTHLIDNGIDSSFFEEIWVKIPVPFKKGDLLYGTNPHRMSDMNIGKEPMVFVHDCCEDLDENDSKDLRRIASRDATDMTAWGYWLGDNGRLYDECMHIRKQNFRPEYIIFVITMILPMHFGNIPQRCRTLCI